MKLAHPPPSESSSCFHTRPLHLILLSHQLFHNRPCSLLLSHTAPTFGLAFTPDPPTCQKPSTNPTSSNRSEKGRTTTSRIDPVSRGQNRPAPTGGSIVALCSRLAASAHNQDWPVTRNYRHHNTAPQHPLHQPSPWKPPRNPPLAEGAYNQNEDDGGLGTKAFIEGDVFAASCMILLSSNERP